MPEGNGILHPPIPASVLLTMGKHLQDVGQAWADPDMTEGKMQELMQAGKYGWNIGATYPQLRDKRNIMKLLSWLGAGGGLETLREYMSYDADGNPLVLWDLQNAAGELLFVD